MTKRRRKRNSPGPEQPLDLEDYIISLLPQDETVKQRQSWPLHRALRIAMRPARVATGQYCSCTPDADAAPLALAVERNPLMHRSQTSLRSAVLSPGYGSARTLEIRAPMPHTGSRAAQGSPRIFERAALAVC
jgi:hypothetical protein